VLGYLQRSEFTKNIFILASGSSIAQLIPFLAEPVLSRIFTPAEFGVFEIYVAIVMMLGVIATARYEMAIILPKTENKAINVLVLSLLIVVGFTLVLVLLIHNAQVIILRLIPVENFGKYLLYIPLGILLFGINRSFMFWLLRQKQMKSMSVARISESTGKAGSSILFGALNFSSLGLIWGHLAGQFISAAFMIRKFIYTDRQKVKFLSGKTLVRQSRKYAEFPMVNVPIALSEMLQISGIIFIFSFYYDNTSVGEFSKALRILLIPLNLIGTSISQVFYQKANNDFSKGINISKSLKQIVKRLLKWSILPLILFLFISPWLFGFVLGPMWVTSGEYARILAIWIFFKFITGPIAVIPLIINKQKQYFLLTLTGNLLMICALVIPGMFNIGTAQTLMILSISQAIFVVFLYFKVLSIYNSSSKMLNGDQN